MQTSASVHPSLGDAAPARQGLLEDGRDAGLLGEAMALVSDVLGAEMVVVLQQDAAGRFVTVATLGLDAPAPPGLTHDDPMAALAVETGRPVVSSDLGEDHRFAPPQPLLDAGVASAVCVELGISPAHAAVIAAYSTSRGAFDESAADTLRFVAHLIAASVISGNLGHRLAGHEPDEQALLRAAVELISGGQASTHPHDGRVVGTTPAMRHALANVMQVVGGFTDLLSGRIGSQPELVQISRAVERGTGLLASPGMPDDRDGYHHGESAADVAHVLGLVSQLLSEGVEIEIAAEALVSDTEVAMDGFELARSLDALVRNAAATSAGTPIRLGVACRTFEWGASAVGLRVGTYAVFSIECGSAAPSLVRPTGAGGHGLGAARDAIVRAGGSITYARTGPRGPAFTVYVPVACCPARVPAAPPRGAAA